MRKLHPQKGDATPHPVPAPAPSAAPGASEVSYAPAEVQRPPADPQPPPSSTSTPFPVLPLDQFLWYHMVKPDFKLLKKVRVDMRDALWNGYGRRDSLENQ